MLFEVCLGPWRARAAVVFLNFDENRELLKCVYLHGSYLPFGVG